MKLKCGYKKGILLIALGMLVTLPLFTQDEGKTEAVSSFYQMSLPGLGFDYMVAVSEEESSVAMLYYRHNLISAFNAFSNSPRILERARWEVYGRVGISQALPIEGLNIGAISALGWTISLETPGTVRRRVLIPFTGFEIGYLLYNDGVNAPDSSFFSAFLLGLDIFVGPMFTSGLNVGLMHATRGVNQVLFKAGAHFSVIF